MPPTKRKASGLYWHVHHDRLFEWCYDYAERAEFIRTDKPEHERALRLRLMQPVKAKLGDPAVLCRLLDLPARQRDDDARLVPSLAHESVVDPHAIIEPGREDPAHRMLDLLDDLPA